MTTYIGPFIYNLGSPLTFLRIAITNGQYGVETSRDNISWSFDSVADMPLMVVYDVNKQASIVLLLNNNKLYRYDYMIGAGIPTWQPPKEYNFKSDSWTPLTQDERILKLPEKLRRIVITGNGINHVIVTPLIVSKKICEQAIKLLTPASEKKHIPTFDFLFDSAKNAVTGTALTPAQRLAVIGVIHPVWKSLHECALMYNLTCNEYANILVATLHGADVSQYLSLDPIESHQIRLNSQDLRNFLLAAQINEFGKLDIEFRRKKIGDIYDYITRLIAAVIAVLDKSIVANIIPLPSNQNVTIGTFQVLQSDFSSEQAYDIGYSLYALSKNTDTECTLDQLVNAISLISNTIQKQRPDATDILTAIDSMMIASGETGAAPELLQELLVNLKKKKMKFSSVLTIQQLIELIDTSDDFFNVIQHLNSSQFSELCGAIQNNLPRLIQTANEFSTLFLYLKGEQCGIVFEVFREKLPDYIKSADDFRLTFCHLTPDQRKQGYKTVKKILPDIIKTPQNLKDILEHLDHELCEDVLHTIEGNLAGIIQNASSFNCALSSKLDYEKRTLLCVAMKKYLPDIIKSASDLSTVFIYLDDKLSAVVCDAVKHKLSVIATSLDDFRVILSGLNDNKYKTVFDNILIPLRNFIKTPSDFIGLQYIIKKEHHKLVFEALKDILVNIIKSKDDFICILKNLTTDNRVYLRSFMQNNLCSLDVVASDFENILHYVDDEEYFIVVNLMLSNLSYLVNSSDDFNKFIRCLRLKEQTTVCGALQEKIISLINTANDFKNILEGLKDRNQRTKLYTDMESKLPGFIRSACDFNYILGCLLPLQRTAIYAAIHDKLADLIFTTNDFLLVVQYLNLEQSTGLYNIAKRKQISGFSELNLYEMMRWNFSYDERKNLLFLMKDNLPNIIKYAHELNSILTDLTFNDCEALFDNMRNILHHIVKTPEDVYKVLSSLEIEPSKRVIFNMLDILADIFKTQGDFVIHNRSPNFEQGNNLSMALTISLARSMPREPLNRKYSKFCLVNSGDNLSLIKNHISKLLENYVYPRGGIFSMHWRRKYRNEAWRLLENIADIKSIAGICRAILAEYYKATSNANCNIHGSYIHRLQYAIILLSDVLSRDNVLNHTISARLAAR